MEWYHSQSFGYYAVCKDYLEFCVQVKNYCIIILDDVVNLKLDIQDLKEESRSFKDRTEFLYTSLVNMNYYGLVLNANALESMINAIG